MKSVRILHLEPVEEDSRRIRLAIEKGFDVEWLRAADEEEFRAQLQKSELDVILSAYDLPDFSGIDAFEAAADIVPDVPFLIVSGSIDPETAVEAMRLGVSDYVMKDDLVRLVPAVTRELHEAVNRREMLAAEKALAESEDRLRLALRAAGIGAWELDLKTDDATWSPEASAILGVTVAGSKGATLREVVFPEDIEVIENAARMAIGSRRAFDVKIRLRRRGGGVRWVASSGKCEFDRDGEPLRLVGTIRDITHEKEAQDALVEAEERYRLIAETASDGVVSIDREGVILFVNPAVEAMFGYERDELLGQPLTVLMPRPVDRSHTKCFGRYIATGERRADWSRMEAPGVRKDGSAIFLQLSFGEYRKGEIHVFTGFIRDITEAKLQADALKRSEHNFRALVQATTEYVWRLDERGNLLEFPQWWVDLTGQSYEDSLKYGWVQMVHPDDQERVRTQYAEALANGTSVSLELRIRNRQGKYRHYSANGVPIPGEAGPRWICALTDISAQRKLEERYKVVSSMSADYMFAAEVDANGNLSMDWVAGALEAITGRGEEYFRNGGTWRSIVHPDDRAQEDADAAAVFEGRQVESEIRIVRPDGETVWVCRLARPVWDDEANRVAAIVGAVKDVTERKSAELAVREREEYLRMVLNAEPQSVAVFGPSGELLDVNPAGVAMLEAASEEKITGRNVLAFLAAADREPFIAALGRAFAGEDVNVTYQMKGLRGTERRMDMCAVPIRNSDGEITSVLGVSRDITERHRIQAALVESEKQYSDLINTVEGIVWEVDISTMRFTFVSQQAESMLGFPLERWYEDHFWADQIHPEDRDFAINYCAAETAKGEGHSFEYRMMAADGSVVWLRDIVSVVVEEGKPVKLRGIMVDVTEQRRLDAAMKQQAVLIEQSNEAIFVWDLDHGVIEWNLGCEKLYGYKRDEALGLFPYDLLHSRFPDSVQDFREELSAAGSWNGELTQATAAGDELIVESRVQLIELNGRKVVLQTSRDLTEMRRAEAALLASEEQLRQAQKLESIGILAGGLAHDFNNMLTAINGYSDLILRRTAKDNPIRSYLEEIKKAGERSADLTRQLLAFSRRQILQPSLLDLNAVIDDTTSLLKRLIGADITIDTRLAADLWRIKADHGQLTQVLMNLMINARDAMPDGGSVTIETDNVELDEEYAGNTVGVMPGRYVMLAISDTGIGMDEETRSRVFEPFFTTKPVGRGTGLGLSTVYGIVKQSGGNVWVYSEPGRGSTFKVYLPQAAGEPEALHAGTERRQMHMGSEKILLVEDEDSVRRLAKQILETCGYEVYEASNGAAAFSEFEKEWAEIDLLVTDVVMPGMGGRELSEMARERRPDLKVLFTSGYTDDAVVRRGILDEGHNFLQKPFTFDALARKVRTVLDETSVRPYSPSRLLTHFQNESS